MPIDETPLSLVARLRNQEETAWGRFVDWAGPCLHQFLLRRLPPGADARDVLQNVFLQIFRSFPTFDPARGGLRTFLYAVVRSKLVDAFRARQRRRELTDQELALFNERDTAADFDETYVAWALRVAAERARPDFSEPHFLAFWMTYGEGRTVEEAAERLGLSLAAARTARSHVKARVEEIIRFEGLE